MSTTEHLHVAGDRGPDPDRHTRRAATYREAPDVPLPWSAPVHAEHAGTTLDGPQPILLDRAWPYEPAACLTGFRVIALRVTDGSFVCPLCGLRTS